MNLFLAGWNLAPQTMARCDQLMPAMRDTYPTLDLATTKCNRGARGTYVATLSTSVAGSAPREYAYNAEGTVVLFDGTPTSTDKSIIAHRASSLAANWSRLTTALDGQYVALRIDTQTPKLELQSDCLGVHQTFYAQHDGQWLLSNSARLLAAVFRFTELDPTGLSLFLGQGWVGGEHTLTRGVNVIPAAQSWCWTATDSKPIKRTYHQLRQCLPAKQHSLGGEATKALAQRLKAPICDLADTFDLIECPITAGRDSRLLVAMTISGGVDAQFFTGGDPASADVKIAKRIAQQFDLSHTVTDSHAALLADWETLSRQFVRQTDGMTSLSAAKNVQYSAPDGLLPIHLYGGGGEIARGFFMEPKLFRSRPNARQMAEHISGSLHGRRANLLLTETIERSKRHIAGFVDEQIGEGGAAAIDTADLFYAYDRVRRWGGAARRPFLPSTDVYSPFCTRPFLEAAFAIPPWQRYQEHLHYGLTQALVPELLDVPYQREWRGGRLWSLLLAGVWGDLKQFAQIRTRLAQLGVMPLSRERLTSKFMERNLRLETTVSHYYELCSDNPNWQLWDLVSRPRLLELIGDESKVRDRIQQQQQLWDIFTLVTYQQECA